MSKFTMVKRGPYPAVEVYDGDTFLSVGLTGIGGGFQIHLSAEEADELGDVLRTLSLKQLKLIKQQEVTA